jgi:hypothetical protein
MEIYFSFFKLAPLKSITISGFPDHYISDKPKAKTYLYTVYIPGDDVRDHGHKNKRLRSKSSSHGSELRVNDTLHE